MHITDYVLAAREALGHENFALLLMVVICGTATVFGNCMYKVGFLSGFVSICINSALAPLCYAALSESTPRPEWYAIAFIAWWLAVFTVGMIIGYFYAKANQTEEIVRFA